MVPTQGEDSILQLFVRNTKTLDWSVVDYSYYLTYRFLVAFAGGILAILVLVKWFKLSDWLIGLIACLSQIGGSITYALTTNDLMMYIAPVVDMLNGTMITAVRSMISKIIPKEEMGRVNAVVSVIDSMNPLWDNPAYNAIYKATASTLPGTVFYVSAAFTIPPVFLFTCFGWINWGNSYREQNERIQAPQDLASQQRSDNDNIEKY